MRRSSLACTPSSISPISSRKIVPPSAWAKRPAREVVAPVKAPRTCPKSSDSTSGGGDLGAAAHRDDGRPGRHFARRVQDFEAAHAGHADVRQDHVEALLLQLGKAGRAVCRDDLVSGRAQNPPQAPEERIFVIAEE